MKRSIHAVAWVLLVVAAVALWPQRWGGTMTYVITSGTSMQPMFTAGDLAILRTTGDYRVGDVAAYRSDELKTVVMHRVLTEKDGTYTFQGDNNDFIDPDQVREDQMLGKLALRVPGVGRHLTWFVKPINLMIAAAALFLLFGDRRKDNSISAAPQKTPLGHVRLVSLQLPPSAVTAQVADEADLDRLAAHYDRPVLEVEGAGRRYVLDGAVVYTWVEAQSRPSERRATPQGRDWNYPPRHLQSVPAPRQDAAPRQDEEVARVSSL